MGVFTFVCRESGANWKGKHLNGDLEASADNTFDLQRKLVQAVLATDSSGGVQSSFTYVTPSSAVVQVIVGGGVVGTFVGGGGAAAPAASSGGGAPEAPAAEKKEEKKEEEESDDDMGFSLFD